MSQNDSKVPRNIQDVVERLRRGELKVVQAPTAMVEQLRPEVDELLAAICDVVGVSNPWISDGSRVSDFTGGFHGEVEAISSRLGIEVGGCDYLWEVAVRLARKRERLS